MKKVKIIIVYSFALRDHEPNPCNIRLAKAAERIRKKLAKRGEKVYVVAQRSAATALRTINARVDYTVAHYRYDGTTDTEDITAQALHLFKATGYTVKEVIPVAHSIQQIKCIPTIRKHGYKTRGFFSLVSEIGHIGTDSKSKQWWARGPIRILIGAAFQVLFGGNTRQRGVTELFAA